VCQCRAFRVYTPSPPLNFKVAVLLLTFEYPDTSINPPTVSVTARVDDGERYRFKKITFTGNKAIVNTALLRNSFPMKDGDIFDTSKVREGLENLRKLYGQYGYINFTPVPDTKIDDENKLIALDVDLDEGAAFVVRSFAIAGADEQKKAALTALWPEMLQPGRVYNTRLVELFIQQAREQNLLPPDADEPTFSRDLDETNHTVDIVLRLQPK
jgi:outer membrane protein insertion porin family